MRAAKLKMSQKKTAENHERALGALEWAKREFPFAVAENSRSYLVKKAAMHIGVHLSTFYRWLRLPK